MPSTNIDTDSPPTRWDEILASGEDWVIYRRGGKRYYFKGDIDIPNPMVPIIVKTISKGKNKGHTEWLGIGKEDPNGRWRFVSGRRDGKGGQFIPKGTKIEWIPLDDLPKEWKRFAINNDLVKYDWGEDDEE